VVQGAHLCAMMRGVKKNRTRMVTSAMRGVFETDATARQELLAELRSKS
jgi:GTP cyclohydrolase IA